jgi:hypothetical protein
VHRQSGLLGALLFTSQPIRTQGRCARQPQAMNLASGVARATRGDLKGLAALYILDPEDMLVSIPGREALAL